jgi:hypothetical protein
VPVRDGVNVMLSRDLHEAGELVLGLSWPRVATAPIVQRRRELRAGGHQDAAGDASDDTAI